MGQKINPLLFRLGINKSHHSFWFAKPKDFSRDLQEDERIRNFIQDYVEKNNKKQESYFKGIARIEILKKIGLIRVIIFIGFPNCFIDVRTHEIEYFNINVWKGFLFGNRRFNISIKRTKKPYGQPNIIAEYIASQLKNRVSFRKAMKKAIELTELAGAKGIQVQISGRINGNELARVEWLREGRVSLQKLHAKIDYCSHAITTIYGVLGIKIWISR
uniref:Small ribosomal subunit protein uS3c n=1 Tax=Didymoplexis pallens TaxID=2848458 RepID=A0A976UFI3_9ASPA|nr:ribosomal protein S3 [Didymoplexis pallens]YP_010471668.1 ribosomal protein S3 [Didymoplexis pallens]UVG41014.1 ribosomal protein S3 [Didymoplexis pallens]UVG41025.1 ribosomal protein S3 [Didymoplexis pallens]